MSQPQVCLEFCRIYLLITPFPAANGIIKIRDLAVKEIERLWTANQMHPLHGRCGAKKVSGVPSSYRGVLDCHLTRSLSEPLSVLLAWNRICGTITTYSASHFTWESSQQTAASRNNSAGYQSAAMLTLTSSGSDFKAVDKNDMTLVLMLSC